MATITKVSIMIFLIILGISMSSNNYIHRFIVTHIFFHQPLATKMLRPLGIIIAISSVLYITPYLYVGILLNLVIAMFLIFNYIRSQSAVRKHTISPRKKAIQSYQMEILAKRQHINRLKSDIAKQNRNKELKTTLTEKSD